MDKPDQKTSEGNPALPLQLPAEFYGLPMEARIRMLEDNAPVKVRTCLHCPNVWEVTERDGETVCQTCRDQIVAKLARQREERRRKEALWQKLRVEKERRVLVAHQAELLGDEEDAKARRTEAGMLLPVRRPAPARPEKDEEELRRVISFLSQPEVIERLESRHETAEGERPKQGSDGHDELIKAMASVVNAGGSLMWVEDPMGRRRMRVAVYTEADMHDGTNEASTQTAEVGKDAETQADGQWGTEAELEEPMEVGESARAATSSISTQTELPSFLMLEAEVAEMMERGVPQRGRRPGEEFRRVTPQEKDRSVRRKARARAVRLIPLFQAIKTYDKVGEIGDEELSNEYRRRVSFGEFCDACGLKEGDRDFKGRVVHHRSRSQCPAWLERSARDPEAFWCSYPLCSERSQHSTLTCPVLHMWCWKGLGFNGCGKRGHSPSDCHLGHHVLKNIFDKFSGRGLWTRTGGRWGFHGGHLPMVELILYREGDEARWMAFPNGPAGFQVMGPGARIDLIRRAGRM